MRFLRLELTEIDSLSIFMMFKPGFLFIFEYIIIIM